MKINNHKTSITFLAAPAAANDPQIIELCHVVLHDRGVVSQLAAEVFIVADAQIDNCPILDVAQRDHLEGHRQCLVGPETRIQQDY